MTSQGPYLAELNVTHYDNECTKKPVIIPKTKENNLLGFLQNNKEYSIFAYLVDLAKLSGLFNSDQVYITLFAVTNKEIKKHYPEEVFLNLDLLSARKIILNHTLERNISLNMLKSINKIKIENMSKLNIGSIERKEIGEFLKQYYSYHIDGLREIKSLRVMESILNKY